MIMPSLELQKEAVVVSSFTPYGECPENIFELGYSI
jgi:hypothetical protein